MNKLKVSIIALVVLITLIAVLMYNKAKMATKAKNDTINSYAVSVVTVGKQKLAQQLSLVGTIAANNDVAIVSETQGKIIDVYAKVGDYKSAGSIIYQVDDEMKKAGHITAETNYEKAKKDLTRYESLRKENTVSDTQIESARLAFKSAEAQYIIARRQYNDTKITTPISGVITSKLVDVGNYVQSGNVVANVVDVSRLKVKLNVAERDAFRLNVGGNVEVTTDVYPGVAFRGKIESISSKADEAHSYPIEVGLANSKDHPLKAGMFGRVSFTSTMNNDMLTIPREALVGSMKKPQVFVVEGLTAKLRNIVVGSEVGRRLTVLSGLNDGDTIVVNGQNNLKDNVAVTIVK